MSVKAARNTLVKLTPDVANEITNGVVAWRRVGLWFKSAKMVKILKMAPPTEQKLAITLKMVEIEKIVQNV